MKVWFSHGKESGPWGSKILRLAEAAKALGCEVDSVDYRDLPDPDQRVDRLVEILGREAGPCILVGSSMGGYVSLVASQRLATSGVFLLAPAVFMPGYRVQDFQRPASRLEIVHGWSDDVIPPDHAIRFARAWSGTLHLIDGDHRLNSVLDTVSVLFECFLRRVLQSEAIPQPSCPSPADVSIIKYRQEG
jgi:pimeloyl-ACP methyl ester carboxylesterase